MTLSEIVEQLEFCGYECEGGPLKNNVAFIELKNMTNTITEAQKEALRKEGAVAERERLYEEVLHLRKPGDMSYEIWRRDVLRHLEPSQ